jgi:hypothetical protein
MKIRKALLLEKETNIYLYENKKEEYTLVAIPNIEWSTRIPYEEETSLLKERLRQSLEKQADQSDVLNLTLKILQWVREM